MVEYSEGGGFSSRGGGNYENRGGGGKGFSSGGGPGARGTEEGRKLFIGGLDWNVDDETLRSQFSKCGPIEYAKVGKLFFKPP